MRRILTACAVAALLSVSGCSGAKDDGGTSSTAADTGSGAKPPTAAEVKLTAKITERTCYGEAGCAVTWHPEVTYKGAGADSWVITYEVTGIESGTDTGQIVMAGAKSAKQNDKHARTAKKDSKITLKVTEIKVD